MDHRPASARTASTPVLVTGATGYVGGRLVPGLLRAGFRVRVLVRDPERLRRAPWRSEVEVVCGNVLDPQSLPMAMTGAGAAYYLVHSMRSARDFQTKDVLAARHFARAARAAAVGRIIYLGGLGDPASQLSAHLRSRQDTGRALGEAGVPVTEFRAAIIVGSGSVSFEMIRYLVERIPVMICPRWVYGRVQPIAIGDVLRYLIAALRVEASAGQIVEIGGTDVLTYAEMLAGYAHARRLRRWLIPVPVLTPRLSAYWVHWMTPCPADIARPLVEGLRSEVVVRDDRARALFPWIAPIGYAEAVRLALADLEAQQVETSWSDPLASSEGPRPDARLVSHAGTRVVLCHLGLAAARSVGPPRRRGGVSARPAIAGHGRARRGHRFLAGRSGGARTHDAAARRDEGSRPRVAAV